MKRQKGLVDRAETTWHKTAGDGGLCSLSFITLVLSVINAVVLCPLVVTVCTFRFSHSPHFCSYLPASYTQLVAWLASPGLSAAAHLQSEWRLLWLAQSLPDCSLLSSQTFQHFLGRISRLRPCFFLTYLPHLCLGKDLHLLFPTTSFICVLPDSWLPVSAWWVSSPLRLLGSSVTPSPVSGSAPEFLLTWLDFMLAANFMCFLPACWSSEILIKLITNSIRCVLQLGSNLTHYTCYWCSFLFFFN